MLSFIIMNLTAALTASLLVKHFFYFKSAADRTIAFFVIFLSQVVILLQSLGIARALYSQNVIIANLIILLCVFFIIKLRKLTPKGGILSREGAGLAGISFNKVEIFALAVILGFGLVKIFINLINPPFGWDDLNYHFTFPVEWLKHGNLENPLVVFCDPSPTYYPINGSLIFFWLILPFKNVFIADLGQVPFFIAAFFAVYSLAKKFKLSKEYSLFAASIFTLVPNYFKQLEIAYVDVIVAALFLIALNYLFLLRKDSFIKNTVLYSLSLGLMLGTKTTALPFALLLFVPFLYFCLKKVPFKKSVVLLALSTFLIVLTGGFAYIRNLIQTGNSLYPLEVKVFNLALFKGVIDSAVYRAHVLPGDYNLGKILFSEGLGAQTVIFFLPAVFLGLPLALLKRRRDFNFNTAFFMLLPALLILIYRFIIPLPNLRYIYAALGVGFIIAFYSAEILKLRKPVVKVLVVICALASLAELAGHRELVASLILSFILFFALPRLPKYLKIKKITGYLIAISIVAFLALIFLERDYAKNEYPRYARTVDYSGFWPDAVKAWAWLNQNTRGNNVAYAGRPVPFPLYGSGFKNNVYYVSVNKVDPVRLEYFKNSKYLWGYDYESVHKSFREDGNYRGGAGYRVWLSNLLRRKTDYLFIYSLHQTKQVLFPLEDRWAKRYRSVFKPVFNNDTVRIYKIVR